MRLQWYSVGAELRDLKRIATGLRRLPYGGRSKQGFLLDDVREAVIRGRFVEKAEWDDTIVDPMGRRATIPRVEYLTTEFRLSREQPLLELANPARSTSAFASFLADAVDAELALSVVDVPLIRWVQALERLVGQCALTMAGSFPTTMDATTHAKFVIEGTSDVRSHLGKGEMRKAKLAKVGLQVRNGDSKFAINLYSTARATVADAAPRETRDKLRDALTTAAELH